MKKLAIALSLLIGFTVGEAEASELIDNVRKTAQPTQSKYAYKSLQIRRFVLAGNSNADYYKIINAVARGVGSDNQKIVRIIWSHDKLGAERIKKALIEEKGISKNRINVLKNTKKRPLYPIYVEVEGVDARSTKCRVTTAERMVIYRDHDPCATENNNRIQKRN